MSMIKQLLANDETLYFIFNENQILVLEDEEPSTNLYLPNKEIFTRFLDLQFAKDWFYMPDFNYATMLTEENAPTPKNTKWVPLRQLFSWDKNLTPFASHGIALLKWRNQTRFCSCCGSPLIDHKVENARYCYNCDKNLYPTISPCIIVKITKNDKILLARHAHRNTDVYTCLAGYVEPGETLEECVKREVFEETGIEVTNIKYVESQSWPFPDQLMIGFTADYAGGEPKLQPEEIQEVLWFSKDNLPPIPKPGSLAYKLITS